MDPLNLVSDGKGRRKDNYKIPNNLSHFYHCIIIIIIVLIFFSFQVHECLNLCVFFLISCKVGIMKWDFLGFVNGISENFTQLDREGTWSPIRLEVSDKLIIVMFNESNFLFSLCQLKKISKIPNMYQM